MRLRQLAVATALTLTLCDALLPLAHAQHYQTKTPYPLPQVSAADLAPPPGYRAVHTQLLARHGSRGLTGMKADLALYRLVQLAQQEQALTPLGHALAADIWKMMQANALLGYGVAGIRKPGYGNETVQGIREHQQLAQRLYQRLPELFQPAGASVAGTTDSAAGNAATEPAAASPRQILLLSSGKDRAVDSGEFFAQALVALQPGLLAQIVRPAALSPRSSARAVTSGGPAPGTARPPGTDRFLLYFHKLDARADLVSDPQDPLYAGFQASLAYQAWLRSATLQQRLADLKAQPQLESAALQVVNRLFQPGFVRALASGQRQVSNTGSMRFTSPDGQFTNALDGDGETVINSPLDAALALYELYAAAADMQHELQADFHRYLPPAQAASFAAYEDAVSFYTKGPGLRENGPLNFAMAQTLLDDFFNELDAIAAGDQHHLAKLRFAHAEIIIPMAALLGLKGMSEQLPASTPYGYNSSPWRGERVAPMAANIQWDAYRNDQGQVAVRMLYNEQPHDFKPGCDYARIAPHSHFYDFSRLRRCYRPAS